MYFLWFRLAPWKQGRYDVKSEACPRQHCECERPEWPVRVWRPPQHHPSSPQPRLKVPVHCIRWRPEFWHDKTCKNDIWLRSRSEIFISFLNPKQQKYARHLAKSWGMEDRCTFLNCQKMGHLAGLPYDPPMTLFEHPVFPKGTLVQMGGDGDHLGHVTDQASVEGNAQVC